MGLERRTKWVKRAMTFLGMLELDKEKAKEYAEKWNGPAFQRAIAVALKIKRAANIAAANRKPMIGGSDER